MSFICPKCDYEDPPIWRHTLRKLYTSHCHISDLEIWEPELARIIKEKGYICVHHVKYKLNRKGSHVHRIPAKLCANSSEANPSIIEPNKEKHKAKILGRRPNQSALFIKEEVSGEAKGFGSSAKSPEEEAKK